MNKPFGDKYGVDFDAIHVSLELDTSIERRRLRLIAAMIIGDGALILLAFAVAGLIYEGIWWQARAMLGAELLVPLFFTISFYNESYSAKSLVDLRFAARKLALALLIAAALLNFIAFYLKANAEFSRVVFTLGLGFSLPLLIASRAMTTRFVARFWNGKIRNELILDDGGPAFTLPGANVLDAGLAQLVPNRDDPMMFNRLGLILQNQDKVIVSCPKQRRDDWAFLLKAAGVNGEIVSEPLHQLGALGVQRYDAQNASTLMVSTGPLGLRSRITKRGFDVFVASVSLLLLSPVLLLVAAAIKLGDGGPVLFKQQRMGRGNRFFTMLKFRSMSADKGDAQGTVSTGRGDARITRVGRFIRSTSMDELPQLWNVLLGEMSIVGPRPHALGSRAGVEEDAKLFWEVDNRYWRRHSLRPGLTGLAQVRGLRGSTELEQDLTDRLQADLEYIKDWSLGRVIGIIAGTFKVLRHDRAF
ncbi:MAG: sugar transferase [Marinomonas sp.]